VARIYKRDRRGRFARTNTLSGRKVGKSSGRSIALGAIRGAAGGGALTGLGASGGAALTGIASAGAASYGGASAAGALGAGALSAAGALGPAVLVGAGAGGLLGAGAAVAFVGGRAVYRRRSAKKPRRP
jgi:hypothetical protein